MKLFSIQESVYIDKKSPVGDREGGRSSSGTLASTNICPAKVKLLKMFRCEIRLRCFSLNSKLVFREKPCPKPKPMTKWEKYAKEKGETF